MKTKKLIQTSLLILGLTAAGPLLQAQVPSLLTYQGRVQADGSNYSGPGQFKFALVSPGVNTNQTASATAVVSLGSVIEVEVRRPGSGYTTPPGVTIAPPQLGRTATAVATVSNGAVVVITVTDGGSGYSQIVPPRVTIAPPPVGMAYVTYWSHDGTSIGGSEPASAVSVPVQEGLFTVRLGDTSLANMTPLPPAVFTNTDAHLRLWFSDGSAGFQGLSPDQPLTPAPYASYAARAAALVGVTDYTFTGVVTFNPVSGPPFTVGNTTKVPDLNADLLDGLDSDAFVHVVGDTMTGSLSLSPPATLNFGSDTRQMVNLFSTTYGLGVQSGTLYFRGNANFAWFKGGTHSDTTFDAGVGGQALMVLTSQGRLGIGTTTPSDTLSVSGDTFLAGDVRMVAGEVSIVANSTLAKPHLSLLEFEGDDFARLEMSNGGPAWHLAAGGVNNVMNFYNTAEGDVMTLTQDGTLYVRVLTITGGADLAEPFEMPVGIPPGAVVVIDDAHPGRLKLSERAYDTCVAGVVSGAKGVKPGLTLQQHDRLAEGQQVALSGRVYVQADSASGPIKPGDLLTTSDIAGHAMRVDDHLKAQGAILGKAMSSLSEGRGLVLMLVTLQ